MLLVHITLRYSWNTTVKINTCRNCLRMVFLLKKVPLTFTTDCIPRKLHNVLFQIWSRGCRWKFVLDTEKASPGDSQLKEGAAEARGLKRKSADVSPPSSKRADNQTDWVVKNARLVKQLEVHPHLKTSFYLSIPTKNLLPALCLPNSR